MLRRCECGADGMCLCTTRRVGDDAPRKLQASVPTLPPVPVHRVLLAALTRAGFSQCGDGSRLSAHQLAVLMDRAASIQARIELKQLCDAAGIMPQAAR
jgi:hypothetical protein